jgi:colanic acid/amylovoran biosynthesis protein
MNKILVTGLCTLHWGRLEYGNIGNYYIVEPLFRLLHKHFPNHEILTTFQMTEEFERMERVKVLPMDLYYNWNVEKDVKNAYCDVEMAKQYCDGKITNLTQYDKLVSECELVINVSGDMWGDNAEHVGRKRFLVDCLKMKATQLLGIKTILYAVTPGPFDKVDDSELAIEVFNKFSLIIIREKLSKDNLKKWGFSIKNVIWAPCPSFLFEPNLAYRSKWTDYIENAHKNERRVVGITFGGFNMPVGPYDMWPRDSEQYTVFFKLAEYLINNLNMDIVIFSHTNGFELPPNFKLKNGRDFTILKRYYELLLQKNEAYKKHVVLVDEPLLPCDMKAFIGKLDMLITGRVHASVAATSQCVPTVYMEYDRNVIYSDKMYGFSSLLEMEKYVCVPGDLEGLIRAVTLSYNNLDKIKSILSEKIPAIKEKADSVFGVIENYV